MLSQTGTTGRSAPPRCRTPRTANRWQAVDGRSLADALAEHYPWAGFRRRQTAPTDDDPAAVPTADDDGGGGGGGDAPQLTVPDGRISLSLSSSLSLCRKVHCRTARLAHVPHAAAKHGAICSISGLPLATFALLPWLAGSEAGRHLYCLMLPLVLLRRVHSPTALGTLSSLLDRRDLIIRCTATNA